MVLLNDFVAYVTMTLVSVRLSINDFMANDRKWVKIIPDKKETNPRDVAKLLSKFLKVLKPEIANVQNECNEI